MIKFCSQNKSDKPVQSTTYLKFVLRLVQCLVLLILINAFCLITILVLLLLRRSLKYLHRHHVVSLRF